MAEEKLARRISVGKDHEIPTLIQNPVPNPSHLDSALWDLTLSKVRGVAKQQRVLLEPSIKQLIEKVNPEDAAKAIKKLASAIAQTDLPTTNEALYIQGASDMSSMWLRMSLIRTQAMDEIRVVAAKWRKKFFYHSVKVLAPAPPQRQINIALDDLEQ